MGGMLNDVGSAALGGAEFALDPLNISGLRSSSGGNPYAGSGGQHPGFWDDGIKGLIAKANAAAQATQTPMGMMSTPQVGTPVAPPAPAAHWGYTPGHGTTWQTPTTSNAGQTDWTSTAPGAAPGNRI